MYVCIQMHTCMCTYVCPCLKQELLNTSKTLWEINELKSSKKLSMPSPYPHSHPLLG